MIAKKYLQSQNQIVDTLDSTVIASLPISVSSTPSPFQCLQNSQSVRSRQKGENDNRLYGKQVRFGKDIKTLKQIFFFFKFPLF